MPRKKSVNPDAFYLNIDPHGLSPMAIHERPPDVKRRS
jgi:hypothetical protein